MLKPNTQNVLLVPASFLHTIQLIHLFSLDRAIKGGMDPSVANWLLSTIGFTNTLGRIICGIISSLPGIDALTINNVALTLGGIATILSGLSMGTNYQFAYAAIFGLAICKYFYK